MFKSLSITAKIGIALAILIIGYTISVIVGFFTGQQIQRRAQFVEKYLYPASRSSQLAKTAFDKQYSLYSDAVMEGDLTYIDSATQMSNEVKESLQSIINLKKLDLERIDKNELQRIDDIRKTLTLLNNFSELARIVYTSMSVPSENIDNQSDNAHEALKNKAETLNDQKTQLSNDFIKYTTTFSELLKQELAYINTITRRQESINLIIYSVVVVIALTLISFIIRRSVTIPIKKAVVMIQDVSEGDLSKEFTTEMNDEIGQIVMALNKMVKSLREITHMVMDATHQFNSSANEIAAAVEDQAAITSQQSSAVSEITATMEELSVTSNQIAGHSNSVAEIAGKALENTKEGAEYVEKVMGKMTEISQDNQNNIRDIVDLGKKSEEITKVMEIINTIADQTKLIAFNAALEASSAGEAGKRFSVVAVEIRRLADNVIESTSEIEGKIKEIQQAVNHMVIASEKSSKGIQEGMEYSTQTAAKIENIVDGSQATADAAKQISLSTQQGKTASEQVLSALKEIDKGAKQAADSISQISLISKHLNELSSNMTHLVNRFKLK